MFGELTDQGLDVECYVPGCKGVPRTITIHNINEDDRQYIINNNLCLSMEELPIGEYVVYLKHGNDFSGETELTELAKGRSCNDTIKSIVERWKALYPEVE